MIGLGKAIVVGVFFGLVCGCTTDSIDVDSDIITVDTPRIESTTLVDVTVDNDVVAVDTPRIESTTSIDMPKLNKSDNSQLAEESYDDLNGGVFNGIRCVTESNPDIMFTSEVVELSNIKHTAPPGSVFNGMLKRHGYFFVGSGIPSTQWTGYPADIAVRAPVDSWLRQVQVYEQSVAGITALEYEVVLEASCEVWYKLGHIGPLSDRVVGVEIGYNYIDEPIFFSAGEIVSYWSGINPGGNIDLGVFNTTVVNSFTNQERYIDGIHDQQLHEDCPFDYFEENLRNKYFALLSEENNFTKVNTDECRSSASQDVSETISGEWFLSDQYSPAASIGISLLGWVRFTTRDFELTIGPEEPTYMFPSDVRGSHCYNSVSLNKYVRASLQNSANLLLEYGDGSCTEAITKTLLELKK